MPTQLPPSLQRLLGGPGGPEELEAGFKVSKIVTYIGIMEKKMETTIVDWVYIGIMEKKMETTIVYWGYIGMMELWACRF